MKNPHNRRRKRHTMLLIAALLAIAHSIHAQDKVSIQIKTFDQQLTPYRNIEVSINDKEFVNMGSRGVAFIEIADSELPVKTIRIRNEQLEAASWNYSKGTLEVIVRNKSYQVVRLLVRDETNAILANQKVTYRGRKTVTVITDRQGRVELPLALDERLTAASQFSIDGFTMTSLALSATESVLTASRIPPPTPKPAETTAATKQTPDRSFFRNFDLSKLDSIQSLTVFYAVFKNYDRARLSAEQLKRVDDKFNELVAQLENSVDQQSASAGPAFMGRITDSTFIAVDIKNLLEQVRDESQTLTDQRAEFDEKLKIINAKLSGGAASLDEATRRAVLSDLSLLERLLIENESRFYKNQNDYRSLINAIKERFFDIEALEQKLTESEQQRLDEQRVFRQRLIIISAIVLVFGFLIILLIYFSNALRKQKKELEAANAEINRINENLEGIVSERTRQLETANKELDTFLYRASHDMRTPVRSILGLCHIANMIVKDEPKELVKRITDTTVQMDRLLKKLSIISEINQPTDFSSVSIAESIQSVHESLKKEINQRHVDFTTDCASDLVIQSYPNLVKTIITNMAENAIYYSSLNGVTPRITLTASQQNGALHLRVQDNGMGISEEVQARVFDMFFKGTEHSKGHGLGLYIVQKAVQALKGHVEVESIPGKTTTFTVTLPIELSIVKKVG